MDFGQFLVQLLTDAGGSLVSAVTAAFVLAAIGLNLHFGYTGLINIGQAGFMLLGAYGFAITVEYSGDFWLGLLVAIVVAIIAALILGLPTLRLRGDYFSIVTIAFAEIIRMIGDSPALQSLTGGPVGIQGFKFQGPFVALSPLPHEGTLSLGPLTAPYTGGDSWWLRIVSWGAVVIIALIALLLVKSPWGRVLRGIREDEDAVRSLGKNVNLVKMQSLIIGAVFGALGGVFYVLSGSVQADGLGRSQTFLIYTCLLLGGAATVFGPILGSLLYFVFTTILTDVVTTYVPHTVMNVTQIPQFVWILVGVGLMLLVIFRPQGILGNKRELNFIG
ncbi:branched-chain amino acid ABC transporter permease [Gryllotalpicola sp.]|uniref:branched-chain amino acid ABC transporter permease n=1 Tax=Gryllotalpicola sp. TaxID=1932787 RepID=UPI00260D3A95|nr:branched-chain amino acid ABC transporter permease [Gryllotalpicola sp.]